MILDPRESHVRVLAVVLGYLITGCLTGILAEYGDDVARDMLWPPRPVPAGQPLYEVEVTIGITSKWCILLTVSTVPVLAAAALAIAVMVAPVSLKYTVCAGVGMGVSHALTAISTERWWVVWRFAKEKYPVQIVLTVLLAVACVLAARFLAIRVRWGSATTPPPGECGSCGYNLTGNVSGVCPECGAEVPEDLVQREKDGGHDAKAGPRHEQGEPES